MESNTNRLKWLSEELGVSYRAVATFLRVSHSLLIKASTYQRTLPARKQGYLNDPLFDPYDIRSELKAMEPLVWEDGKKEVRIKDMEMRVLRLEANLLNARKDLDSLVERHRLHRAVMHHTRHLPDSTDGIESIVRMWWIVMKNTAWLALHSPAFSLTVRRKLEMKIVLLQAEMTQLQIWLAEERESEPDNQ
jgi:hypothetical protein